jgi:hypothetical protein
VSDTPSEALAALWRLSRAEAEDLRARIVLLERAVMRAVAGDAVGGDGRIWAGLLAEAEGALAAGRARSARIAALLDGRTA